MERYSTLAPIMGRTRHSIFSARILVASTSAISCLVWIALAVWSLLLSNKPIFTAAGVVDVITPLQRELQLLGSVVVLAGVVLNSGRLSRVVRAVSKSPLFGFLSAMVVAMIIGAAVRMSIVELSYVLLLGLSLILAILLWTGPAYNVFIFTKAVPIVCLGMAVVALAKFGAPTGRWLGGIHPNLLGYVLVIGGVYGLVMWRRLGLAMYIFSILMTNAISSRYALLCLLLIGLVHGAVALSKRIGTAATATVAALVLPVAVVFSSRAFSDIFLLSDSSRGVSSGASGRGSLTENSLRDIGDRVILGSGFRNRSAYEGAHNGYVNFLNENGVFVSALFCVVMVLAGLLAIRIVFRSAKQFHAPSSLSAYVYFTSLLACYFQPQVFSFGDAQGIFLIISLAGVIVSGSQVGFTHNNVLKIPSHKALR